MITIYENLDGAFTKRAACGESRAQMVWVDLYRPTRDEELEVERWLNVAVPTREEMLEIEASSRIYQDGGAHVMTAVVLHQRHTAEPNQKAEELVATPVTFMLAGKNLITVRYEEPRAFPLFIQRAEKGDAATNSACAVLLGLLEAIIDREADRAERITGEIDRLSQTIFDMKGGTMTRSKRYEIAIKNIGREGEFISRAREGLHSLDRVLTYMTHVMSERGEEKALRNRVKTASRDITSLEQHVDALNSKVQFLLDATLGMISIEQNNIIKIFSIASVALMPPTLIASIYGMNFRHMPELGWSFGYPMAIGLMIVSAIVPFLYFKRKGWF
jgi:magnesium transporter